MGAFSSGPSDGDIERAEEAAFKKEAERLRLATQRLRQNESASAIQGQGVVTADNLVVGDDLRKESKALDRVKVTGARDQATAKALLRNPYHPAGQNPGNVSNAEMIEWASENGMLSGKQISQAKQLLENQPGLYNEYSWGASEITSPEQLDSSLNLTTHPNHRALLNAIWRGQFMTRSGEVLSPIAENEVPGSVNTRVGKGNDENDGDYTIPPNSGASPFGPEGGDAKANRGTNGSAKGDGDPTNNAPDNYYPPIPNPNNPLYDNYGNFNDGHTGNPNDTPGVGNNPGGAVPNDGTNPNDGNNVHNSMTNRELFDLAVANGDLTEEQIATMEEHFTNNPQVAEGTNWVGNSTAFLSSQVGDGIHPDFLASLQAVWSTTLPTSGNNGGQTGTDNPQIGDAPSQPNTPGTDNPQIGGPDGPTQQQPGPDISLLEGTPFSAWTDEQVEHASQILRDKGLLTADGKDIIPLLMQKPDERKDGGLSGYAFTSLSRRAAQGLGVNPSAFSHGATVEWTDSPTGHGYTQTTTAPAGNTQNFGSHVLTPDVPEQDVADTEQAATPVSTPNQGNQNNNDSEAAPSANQPTQQQPTPAPEDNFLPGGSNEAFANTPFFGWDETQLGLANDILRDAGAFTADGKDILPLLFQRPDERKDGGLSGYAHTVLSRRAASVLGVKSSAFSHSARMRWEGDQLVQDKPPGGTTNFVDHRLNPQI